MKNLVFLAGGLVVGHAPVEILVVEETPELLDEAEDAFDAVGVPRLGHLDGAEEHLVHAQGVGPVFFHEVVGILHVVFGLGHLLHLPAADVLAFFKDKFGIGEVGHPLLERLGVEHIVSHDVDIDADGRDLIAVFQPKGDILVGADDAIDEVGASLDHALVDEFLEGLFFATEADVMEELVPETGIDQVAGGVFGAADVEIHVAPILVGLFGEILLVVVRVHVAEIIAGGAGESGHRVVFHGVALVGPVFGACQWRLTRLGGLELADLGKLDGQLFFRNRVGHAILVVDGERLAPVALAAEDGVAQAVVHRAVADAHCLDLLDHRLAALFDGHSGDEAGVHAIAVFAVHGLLPCVRVAQIVGEWGHHLTDGQVEMTGECKVAAVVGRHGHDGACAVVGQYIVADPNGNAFFCDGVDGVRTREHSAHLLDFGLALALGAVLGPSDVGFHFRLLLWRGDGGNHLVLGAQDHEGHTEDGVRARGEDLEGGLVLHTINIAAHVEFFPVELAFHSQGEPYGCTLAATNPVALDFLQGVCPFHVLQSGKQPFGVCGDTEDPLSHQLALHGEAATDGETVDDLVVG